MFTGIVTDVGRVRSVEKTGGTRFVIETSYDRDSIMAGSSIACAGVSLTVIEKGANAGEATGGWIAVEASQETMSCTSLGDWKPGTPVNLERSLKVGDEIGGHIVSGHVDGVGRVLSIAPRGASTVYVIEAPQDLMKFIATKGSVTVEGVSLTVNVIDAASFGVTLIAHTRSLTTFTSMKPGDGVNLEIDVLARYVARLQEATMIPDAP